MYSETHGFYGLVLIKRSRRKVLQFAILNRASGETWTYATKRKESIDVNVGCNYGKWAEGNNKFHYS